MMAIEPSRESKGEMSLLLGEAPSPTRLRRGNVVEGVVMRLDREGALVDIGGKVEGFVPSHEMRASAPIKVGEEVLAYVLGRHSEDGLPLLSLDQAQEERAWRNLEHLMEAGGSLEAKAVGSNKGGLLVNAQGISGFVPQSQVLPGGELETRLGETLKLKVLEVNRGRGRLILSEREAAQEERAQRKGELLSQLKEGEIRRGRVTGLHAFGAFVNLGGVDGLVPTSEISWERVADPAQVLGVGQEVEVSVMRVDLSAGKVALSLRRAQAWPWEQVVGRYREGQLVQGVITRLTSFGAFARVEDAMEGLIHISELAEHRVGHPKEVVKEGDVLTLKIVKIEPERHRLGLSLKQALDEAPPEDSHHG